MYPKHENPSPQKGQGQSSPVHISPSRRNSDDRKKEELIVFHIMPNLCVCLELLNKSVEFGLLLKRSYKEA